MTNSNFYLDFNVSGAERKRLVKAVSEYTQADAKYLGAPTFAYEVDYFHIDRNGVVSFDDRADSEAIEGLIEALAEQGFVSLVSNLGLDEEENGTEMGLAVEIPLEAVSVGNLTKILDAKGNLIKKALGVDDLRFEIKTDRIVFPWFAKVDADAVTAYTHFISALCEMAKNQKRIAAKEKETDNDKYAFRCFLLRLGFIGAEYKDERKVLLRNLSGSSAFKGGAKTENGEEGVSDDVSE